MFKSILASAALCMATVVSLPASAASFAFDVSWDGTSLSPTSAGTGLSATNLAVGDDFTLTVRAVGDGGWTSLSNSPQFPLNPRIGPGGETFGDVSTVVSNNGVSVLNDDAVNERRCCAELGGTYWESIGAGTVFDMVVMSYTRVAGGDIAGPVEIFGNGNSIDSFWSSSIFHERNFSYSASASPSEVPLPAGALLLLTSLAGIGVMRRRKS